MRDTGKIVLAVLCASVAGCPGGAGGHEAAAGPDAHGGNAVTEESSRGGGALTEESARGGGAVTEESARGAAAGATDACALIRADEVAAVLADRIGPADDQTSAGVSKCFYGGKSGPDVRFSLELREAGTLYGMRRAAAGPAGRDLDGIGERAFYRAGEGHELILVKGGRMARLVSLPLKGADSSSSATGGAGARTAATAGARSHSAATGADLSSPEAERLLDLGRRVAGRM